MTNFSQQSNDSASVASSSFSNLTLDYGTVNPVERECKRLTQPIKLTEPFNGCGGARLGVDAGSSEVLIETDAEYDSDLNVTNDIKAIADRVDRKRRPVTPFNKKRSLKRRKRNDNRNAPFSDDDSSSDEIDSSSSDSETESGDSQPPPPPAPPAPKKSNGIKPTPVTEQDLETWKTSLANMEVSLELKRRKMKAEVVSIQPPLNLPPQSSQDSSQSSMVPEETSTQPETSTKPETSTRPETSTKPETSTRPQQEQQPQPAVSTVETNTTSTLAPRPESSTSPTLAPRPESSTSPTLESPVPQPAASTSPKLASVATSTPTSTPTPTSNPAETLAPSTAPSTTPSTPPQSPSRHEPKTPNAPVKAALNRLVNMGIRKRLRVVPSAALRAELEAQKMRERGHAPLPVVAPAEITDPKYRHLTSQLDALSELNVTGTAASSTTATTTTTATAAASLKGRFKPIPSSAARQSVEIANKKIELDRQHDQKINALQHFQVYPNTPKECDQCKRKYKTFRTFNKHACKPKSARSSRAAKRKHSATEDDDVKNNNEPATMEKPVDVDANAEVEGSSEPQLPNDHSSNDNVSAATRKDRRESVSSDATSSDDEDDHDAAKRRKTREPSAKHSNATAASAKSGLVKEFNFDEPCFKYVHKLNTLGANKHVLEMHETLACKVNDAACNKFRHVPNAGDSKREMMSIRQKMNKMISDVQAMCRNKNATKEELAKLKMRIKFIRAYKQMKSAEYSYTSNKLNAFKVKMQKIFSDGKVDAKGSVHNRITVNDIGNAIATMSDSIHVEVEDLKCVARSLENYLTLVTLSIMSVMVNKRMNRLTRANLSTVLALQYAMNGDKESHPIPSYGNFKLPSDGKLNVIICRNILELCNVNSIEDIMDELMSEFDGNMKNLWIKFLFNFKPSSDYIKALKELYLKYLLASYLALCKLEEKRAQNLKNATYRHCMALVINNCTWFPFKEYANHTDVNLDKYADELFKECSVGVGGGGSSSSSSSMTLNNKRKSKVAMMVKHSKTGSIGTVKKGKGNAKTKEAKPPTTTTTTMDPMKLPTSREFVESDYDSSSSSDSDGGESVVSAAAGGLNGGVGGVGGNDEE